MQCRFLFQITPIRLMLNLNLNRFHHGGHSPHSSFAHASVISTFILLPSASRHSSTTSPSFINSSLVLPQPNPKEKICSPPILMPTTPFLHHSFVYSWGSCMHRTQRDATTYIICIRNVLSQLASDDLRQLMNKLAEAICLRHINCPLHKHKYIYIYTHVHIYIYMCYAYSMPI